MKNSKLPKIGAVAIAIFFIGMALSIPSFSAISENDIETSNDLITTLGRLDFEENTEHPVIGYEGRYIRPEDVSFAGEQNDINYNIDVGNTLQRSLPVYPGEPIDLAPGRGRTGSLEPDNGDAVDYYRFTVCEGQTIQTSITSDDVYTLTIHDLTGI